MYIQAEIEVEKKGEIERGGNEDNVEEKKKEKTLE